MDDFGFVFDLLEKTGTIGNCAVDIEITKRNINALKGKIDSHVQIQLNISLQRYHKEIDELHKMLGINPPSPNEPVNHNPRNELQYITDRIPAYIALRELKGEFRERAIKHLLSKSWVYRTGVV